jgi:hypothetical protein
VLGGVLSVRDSALGDCVVLLLTDGELGVAAGVDADLAEEGSGAATKGRHAEGEEEEEDDEEEEGGGEEGIGAEYEETLATAREDVAASEDEGEGEEEE